MSQHILGRSLDSVYCSLDSVNRSSIQSPFLQSYTHILSVYLCILENKTQPKKTIDAWEYLVHVYRKNFRNKKNKKKLFAKPSTFLLFSSNHASKRIV